MRRRADTNTEIREPGRLRDAARLCGRSKDWMVKHWRQFVHAGKIGYIPAGCSGGFITVDLADVRAYLARCVAEGTPLLP